jgi:class 3 adenylate cyclase
LASLSRNARRVNHQLPTDLATEQPCPAGPLAVEERKVVSVLFADLVGATSRAEQMDPEDARALLPPY